MWISRSVEDLWAEPPKMCNANRLKIKKLKKKKCKGKPGYGGQSTFSITLDTHQQCYKYMPVYMNELRKVINKFPRRTLDMTLSDFKIILNFKGHFE